MTKYNHKKIEKKWQDKWKKGKLYQTRKDKEKKKFYVLDMFPYPSGAGLHVGHPKGYIATDVTARMKTMRGYNVLHPMGWDAFGLPAENYAIKNKIHPRAAVEENIKRFKKQLEKIGFTYDWEREINTTDPEYYRWTQWIFLKMFEKGLAYQSYAPINWCPGCQTGLANEDLEGDKCERCGSEVEKRPMRQWVLKMTAYADRLLEDLKLLDWDESIIEQQKNWIGRSEGATVEFRIVNSELRIEVFTTRPDTLFGCTYLVVCPEHEIIKNLESGITNHEEVKKYIEKAKNKSDLERTDLAKEKTGVELKGVKAINPVNNEEVPIWVADYVLAGYGTGAIMAVPAHDERDFEFAKKFGLEIKQVVAPLFIGEGKNKIRKDKEYTKREFVDVIIKHWGKDEYFCLDWNKSNNDWKTFISGGIEKGESVEEAALREAKEESGYQNMRVVKKIGNTIYSRFFAAHKDVNRHDLKRNCIYIELLDNSFIEPKKEEVKNHDGVWIKKEDVKDFIDLEELNIYWDIFQNGEKPLLENGIAINSNQFNGLTTAEFKKEIIKWLEENNFGKKSVNYKMRDWVFSRQRYWGEPIPIVHCEKCGAVAVPEDKLPVKLPEVKRYEPTGTGESPLANIEEWVNTTCPKCGGPAKRETNTMPQWAGSCWYYLRYLDPKNNKALINKDKEKYWMRPDGIDLYVGGAEHATRHLLYARFWHKFLYDINVVSTLEPFHKLYYVGLILAEDGRKMSKRWENVVNPDEIIEKFGADSLRLYEMFMGPFSQATAWNTNGLVGMRRFLEKVWNIQTKVETRFIASKSKVKIENLKLESLLHKTIKKVTEDIENFKFNTAVSQLMILVNEMEKEKEISSLHYSQFLILLSPFAPHIAEELWEKMGNKESIYLQSWPEYDPELIKEKEIELVVQVNGKVRDQIKVPADISEEEAKKLAIESNKIKKWIEGKEIRKVIFVKGKLINIVI